MIFIPVIGTEYVILDIAIMQAVTTLHLHHYLKVIYKLLAVFDCY